jgi:hypothetical protein
MTKSRWSRLIPTRRRVVTYLGVLFAFLVVWVALDIWAACRLRSVTAGFCGTC